jgi:hypothetical protein
MIITEAQAVAMRRGADYYRIHRAVPSVGNPWFVYGASLAQFLAGEWPDLPGSPGPALPAPEVPQGIEPESLDVDPLDLPLANGRTLVVPGTWRLLLAPRRGLGA